MKARVKATGEIVEILEVDYTADNGLVYYKEDLCIEDKPDYWEKLHHQAAIAAMQGICANYNDFTKDNDGSVSNTEMICKNAKIIATALIEKLKNEK